MTRRVVSTDPSAGAVIARTDEIRLERDGTFGGMRLAWDGGTHNTNSASCVYATGGQIDSAISRTVPSYGDPPVGGSNSGSVSLITDQYAGTSIDCSFGDPARARHVTQVHLQRAIEDSTWVGTVTSTVNQ